MNNYFNENWQTLEDILCKLLDLSRTFVLLDFCSKELPDYEIPGAWTAPITMFQECAAQARDWLEKGLKETCAKESEVA